MDQTAIQSGPPKETHFTATAPERSATTWSKAWQETWLYKVLRVLASLRLTVVLFALSFLLVYWGTLAQVDFGINTVMDRYFRSFVVKIPLKFIVSAPWADEEKWPLLNQIRLPYPGGWLLGSLLMTNLFSAHIIRFKRHWTQAGIWMIHTGIAIMMIGEFFTGMYASEGQMSILEGKSANFLQHHHATEFVFIETLSAEKDRVIVVPQSKLRTGSTIQSSELPCDVTVDLYAVNAKLMTLKNTERGWATAGMNRNQKLEVLPEGSGVDSSSKIDFPAAQIILSRDGKELGRYLFWSVLENPDWITIDGKKYQIALRFQRTVCDYVIHLDKFTHKKHPHSEKAFDFRSEIRLEDRKVEGGKERGDHREAAIYMNHPMRYNGETFYQSSTIPDGDTGRSIGTVLQVVRNPAWTFPYWSCTIAGLGMLFHFWLNLSRFIKRSA